MSVGSSDGQRVIILDVWTPGGEVTELAFSTNGQHMVVGTKNFAVRVWGALSGEVELHAPPLAGSNNDGGYHAGKLSCDVVLNPTRGLLMAAGSATGGVIMWGFSDGCPTAELRNNGHEYGSMVAHLAAYPDGRYFASADLTTIKVWCADDYKCRRTLRSAFVVEILLVSGKGRFIFCTGQSDAKHGVIAIWHGHPGKEPIRVLQAHGKQVRCLFAPDDSEVLVSTGLDGRVKVWNVPNGECTRVIWSKGPSRSQLSYAALVNRAKWMLTSCDDGSLQIWAMSTGKCMLTLATVAAGAVQPPPRLRLAASRCGRLVTVAIGQRLQVLDFNVLADRSEAERRGKAGAYLRHALQFIVSPTVGPKQQQQRQGEREGGGEGEEP